MLSIKAVIWFSVQCQDKKNEDAITGSLLRGLDRQRDTEQGGVSTEQWMMRSRGNRVGCVWKEIGTITERALNSNLLHASFLLHTFITHIFKKCYKHKLKIMCNTTISPHDVAHVRLLWHMGVKKKLKKVSAHEASLIIASCDRNIVVISYCWCYFDSHALVFVWHVQCFLLTGQPWIDALRKHANIVHVQINLLLLYNKSCV